MEKIRTEPELESIHLDTPVIDVNADDRPGGDALKIMSSDEGELEEAIAAIERLERALRFTN